jgi:hypothetical protein
MLGWVGKLLGGRSVEVPPDIPTAWAQRLESLLERVNTIKSNFGRPGLARDIMSFVVQGEPQEVLHEVSRGPSVAEKLGLHDYGRWDTDAAHKFYGDDFQRVPARVSLRWAQFLEACAGTKSHRYSFVFPGGVHWPEVLLMHASGRTFGGWSSHAKPAPGLTCESIERALAEAGLPTSAFAAAAFASPVNSSRWTPGGLDLCRAVNGFGHAIRRHADALRTPLLAPAVPQRLHMLELMQVAVPEALEVLAPELCELATSSSKQVRAAAEPLLRKVGPNAIAPLKAIARDGKPDHRVSALRLLWATARTENDEALHAYVREAAQNDKAPSAQALIAEWDGTAETPVVETRYDYSLPSIDWACGYSDATARALETFWLELDAAVARSNTEGRKASENARAQGHKWHWKDVVPVAGGDRRRLRDYLATPGPRLDGKSVDIRLGWNVSVTSIVERFAQTEGVPAVSVLKLMHFFGWLDRNDQQRIGPFFDTVLNTMHRVRGIPTLLELQVILESMGYAPVRLFRNYCYGWGSPVAHEWPDAAVWPFFAHNLELLLQHLNPAATREYWFDRATVYKGIATLPAPPESIVNALFDLALGSSKTERPGAQAALANHPGKEARIVNALADGKGEVRTVAANWLARLQHAPAVPALEQALGKEKNDVAKGAMLDTLEVLGHPVEKYLDRDTLAADAAKSLAKGLPKELEWFPWESIPRVRWADTQAEVGNEVLRWMLAQATKQKSPEPNAVLRKYCRMFEPRDREPFGQFVLDAWLREDVKPVSPEAALQSARAHAQQMHTSMKNYPQHYKDDPNLGKTVDELTAALLPRYQRQPVGSAIASKGVLAVAAACCAERAATPVGRFLKEYYGTRAGQGKALIAMLAWIEHPSATQLMLSIGNRFRTKSFQEEATRQAEALAERKGWTLAELADRTIPSAGFDETGTLELSYGDRIFTARLLPDFKIELHNPEGKKIAALPEPRQDDDPEAVKDAKKAFTTAKKDIKGIVALLADRLYEALCTEREWRFEDWNLYLNQHPVMRRLVQRLVWVESGEGPLQRTFRPLDDGTLTDRVDNEVRPEPAARVRLAHDSILSGDEVAQWQQHLVDYEIVPLFQQLGKGVYALPADKAGTDEIKDFEGHLIEAFALRGRALKLGYTRGAAEDGGWFHVYEKRFPTLGIVAVLEFTGNPLPEENRTVSLISLYFASTEDKSWSRGKHRLGKVPKVLLSECYNDVRLIAAEGSGYHTDWQKKTAY